MGATSVQFAKGHGSFGPLQIFDLYHTQPVFYPEGWGGGGGGGGLQPICRFASEHSDLTCTENLAILWVVYAMLIDRYLLLSILGDS